ncbi:nuclear transport factor 2 family protein [Clostridium folliculivorans]|uniref:Nuclear transport factor 2 family protein n=1 Tax=Clostridium folliculivorans TaxID=2886038 RepID=A0A9W5Y1W1_9CLOT|nr:nuclear transport factor 2 family protein [Clostridium folliculivorans]GKU25206.1 hypothetical protein CFOLD11_20320 [Clostridium folliculivorans]GKU31304.1 hypothetical protein CFB3_34110 [Clostridium folliculivorans]
MDIKKRVLSFWEAVIEQNDIKLQTYFESNAIINWHNTNESFTPEEYIITNCEYPSKWFGEVERIEIINDLAISVTKLWLSDKSISVHATSFIRFCGEKIVSLDEYWGDDGTAPQWRQDKKIGKSIK